jgi:hypothetical protein
LTDASVEDAVVVNLRGRGPDRSAKTAGNGTFRLKSTEAAVLLVSHPEFEPTVLVIGANASNVMIKLRHRASATEWGVPLCVGRPRSGTPVLRLKFDLRGARVKVGRDIDYLHRAVFYGKGSKQYMEIWEGPLVTSGFPSDYWARSSVAFTVAGWACADKSRQGMDVRARHQDGTQSRWIGFLGSFVSYDGASPHAARYFDKIIASMCCQ